MTDLDLMLRFMLQVIVVLAACKAIGWLGRRYLAQTQVVMEMVTGVVLGPSLLGLYWPQAQQWLFPKGVTSADLAAWLQPSSMDVQGISGTAKHPSMLILYVVAQVGLVLYMFLVGMEFDTKLMGNRIRGAVAVSVAGIVAPFAFGAAIALTLMSSGTEYFAASVGVGSRVLYIGAAMSITAFPMLARIIFERGIAGTSMGTLALGAGATDDAVAWSLLALVLALSKGSANYALFAIGGGVAFAALVLTAGKALLRRLGETVERDGTMSNEVFVWTMLFLMAGAYVTDAIGIYAVFGAFLIGAAMPRGEFTRILREKIEYLTVGLFLPFFFVYSGLNTQIGLINTPALWAVSGVVLVAAIVGKGVACTLAARASGEPWRDACAIGTLMNSRGLMELIILNIGLAQGLITKTLFTIMVLMALITTLMASPIFLWIMGRPKAAGDRAAGTAPG